MRKVTGIAVGAGTSAMYIGLGFVPTKVRLSIIDQAEAEELIWSTDMARAATGAEGILRAGVGNTPGLALLTLGIGVQPYYGGDMVSSKSANHVVHKSSMQVNVRGTGLIDWGGDMRSMPGGTGPVSSWTLQTAGSYTGKFDQGVDLTYVNVGSPVFIRPFVGSGYGPVRCVYVTAISNDGNADNEVTLSQAVPSGQVTFMGYRYDFAQVPVGYTMEQGIVINDVTYINVSGQKFLIEAEAAD